MLAPGTRVRVRGDGFQGGLLAPGEEGTVVVLEGEGAEVTALVEKEGEIYNYWLEDIEPVGEPRAAEGVDNDELSGEFSLSASHPQPESSAKDGPLFWDGPASHGGPSHVDPASQAKSALTDGSDGPFPPPPSKSPPPPPVEDDDLAPISLGVRVRAHGLVGAKDFNGRQGTTISAGPRNIYVDFGDHGIKCLRRQNLEPVDEPKPLIPSKSGFPHPQPSHLSVLGVSTAISTLVGPPQAPVAFEEEVQVFRYHPGSDQWVVFLNGMLQLWVAPRPHMALVKGSSAGSLGDTVMEVSMAKVSKSAPHGSDPKTVVWSCKPRGEAERSTIAAQFKSDELAARFRDVFASARAIARERSERR
eukprot:Hpha_TRINITY_DN14058_c0_g1::TRINITY_DN14058_c0_g1_i1::g.44009::m.44009